MVRALRENAYIRLRDVIDPWFAFEAGRDFLTSGGRPHTFNNPCPWQHGQRLTAGHFWVTKGAAQILERAVLKDRAVKKPKKGEANYGQTTFRLMIDHSVPLKVLLKIMRGDSSLHDRDSLRVFLLHHFRRGVLTYAEDQKLSKELVSGKSLKDEMPADWVVGGSPFARYEALGLERRHYELEASS